MNGRPASTHAEGRQTFVRRTPFPAILAATLLLAAACSATPGATIAPPSVGPSPSPDPTIPATPSTSASVGLPQFASDEPLILVARVTGAGGGIFVMRPDGTGVTQLATDVLPGVHKHPDWSPDGQSVVFVDDSSERVWIARLDGSPSATVSACDVPGCDYPAWSPDGTRIAFSRYETNDGLEGPAAVGVYILELATGEVTPVLRLERPLLADAPRWSPDGTELVIQVDQMDDQAYETGAAIAIVSAAGGEPHYLTDFASFAGGPDWGWMTNEIVFSEALRGYKRTPGVDDATWDLFAVHPDGTGLRQITDQPDGQRLVAVRWTPDGRALLSKRFDDAGGGGRIVDPVSGAVTPYLTDAYFTIPLPRPVATGS